MCVSILICRGWQPHSKFLSCLRTPWPYKMYGKWCTLSLHQPHKKTFVNNSMECEVWTTHYGQLLGHGPISSVCHYHRHFLLAIPIFSNTEGAAVRVNQQMLYIMNEWHVCSPFFLTHPPNPIIIVQSIRFTSCHSLTQRLLFLVQKRCDPVTWFRFRTQIHRSCFMYWLELLDRMILIANLFIYLTCFQFEHSKLDHGLT